MNILSKIKTGLWYLTNPKFIPDVWVKIQQFTFNKSKEESEDASLKWCKENEVDPLNGFKFFFPHNKFYNLETAFPETYEFAINQQDNCPYQMGGPGCIDLLYSICEAAECVSAIETGVAYGWSTLAILLSMKNRIGAKLISIDMPYVKAGNDSYVGCVINENDRDKWTLLREPDFTGVPRAIQLLKRIDICHYDSDKSFTGRMRSLPLLWKALDTNGFLISDDISDNLGFKTFCESINRKPVIIKWDNKYTGIIKK
jgi:hypothetical protein